MGCRQSLACCRVCEMQAVLSITALAKALRETHADSRDTLGEYSPRECQGLAFFSHVSFEFRVRVYTGN